MFAEALLFHHLDNLDSKMNSLESALKRDQQVEGEFTGWINSLERILMKKDRYLASLGVAPEKPSETLETLAPPIDEVALQAVPAPEAPSPIPEPVPVATPLPPPVAPPPEPPRPPKRVEAPPMNSLFAEKLQAVLGPQK